VSFASHQTALSTGIISPAGMHHDQTENESNGNISIGNKSAGNKQT
jgi:hypothetical protein